MTSCTCPSMPSGSTMRTEERWGCFFVFFHLFVFKLADIIIAHEQFFPTPPAPPPPLQLYITCHLNAVPVNDAETPNKACTFINGRQVWCNVNCVKLRSDKMSGCVCSEELKKIPFRWRSADGNDYSCGHCQSQSGQTHSQPSSPSKFGPRGFGKPSESEASWRTGLKTSDGKISLWKLDILTRGRRPPIRAGLRCVDSTFGQDQLILDEQLT